MKKKFVILTGSLMIAALSVAVFVNKSQDAEKSLLMRNVEVIAQNEDGGGDSGENKGPCPAWENTYEYSDLCENGEYKPYVRITHYGCSPSTLPYYSAMCWSGTLTLFLNCSGIVSDILEEGYSITC